VIVAVVAWGCFVGAVMAIVVNAGVVVDAVISADVTDVTIPSSPCTDVAGPYSTGIEASCEWVPVPPGGACVWPADTAGPASKVRGRAYPFKIVHRAQVRTLLSHRLLPLALASRSLRSFASAAPPLLALPARPRLRHRDVELDALQLVLQAAPLSH
jgi:hypothetical protein